MLDDPTECYKFYWFDSIMHLLSQNKCEMTFDDIIIGMIADAWYSVTEYHLRLGTKDSHGNSVNSIERAVKKLAALGVLESTARRDDIISLTKQSDKIIHEEKCQISKNVPYRLLSSFLKEVGGNDPLWNQKSRLIAYLELRNKANCFPYTIEVEKGLGKKVIINPYWKKLLVDNMVVIRGWIQMKKIKYLQDRNPGVPGIMYKLEPESEKQRKLHNVRKLWSAVLKISDFKDIYSGKTIDAQQYEIDHFIPWSYVANDEMWNLMPVDSALNSSKRDNLPDWNCYFSGFTKNQYMLNDCIYKYPVVESLFRKCQRDNLNALWSREKLYVKGIKKEQFTKILKAHLKPIYDSAHMQGYGIWTAN